MTNRKRFRLTPGEERLLDALRQGPATSPELASRIGISERRVRELLERVENKGYWIETGEERRHMLLCEPEADGCCPRCRSLGRGNVILASDNPGPLCGPCERAVIDDELRRSCTVLAPDPQLALQLM
jgi:biotin operon repressor